MVGALLLLVITAGFVPLFTSGLGHASTARYRSLANNVARERMEQVRELDYREISQASLVQRFGTSTTLRGATFTISYAVADSTMASGQLKKVTVTVNWTAPPTPSPAIIETLIHQPFLGPRGANLVILPTPTADPLGTPFPVIQPGTNTVEYHVAEADWGFVYANLNTGTQTARDVYCRMMFSNDAGQVLPIGPAADDWKIGSTYLHYTVDAANKVNDVWFAYSFDPTTIPDGYWELQTVAYNEYDEPGNLWRQRVRFEFLPPAVPVITVAQPDNQSVHLTWTQGAETDRDHYVLERQKRDADGSTWPGTWDRLNGSLLGTTSSYLDQGNLATMTDPWGDATTGNAYLYRLTVYDICSPAKTAQATSAVVAVPPPSTTTTTSGGTTTTGTGTTTTTAATTTTTVAGTTTTTLRYTTYIQNNDNKDRDIVIQDQNSSTVYTGTAAKSSRLTLPTLPPGNYQVTATASGRTTVTASFSLPGNSGQIVLTIN